MRIDEVLKAWYSREAKQVTVALETARVFTYAEPVHEKFWDAFWHEMERTVEELDFFLWYEREGQHLEFEHDPYVRSHKSLDDMLCDSYGGFQFVVGVKGEAHYCTDCGDHLGMDSQQQLGDYTATPVYALVGRGSAKQDGPVPARDLYTSSYFEKKRRFEETIADQCGFYAPNTASPIPRRT